MFSFCFQTDTSPEHLRELCLFLNVTHDFLLYQHFYDEVRITEDASCKGNHHHLLLSGHFLSKTGNLMKPSQLYLWEWLCKNAQKCKQEKPSSSTVKSISGYLDYLKRYPPSLAAYSITLINLAESGNLHPT